MKISSSSQNLAMVSMILVEHRLLHDLCLRCVLEKVNKFASYPTSSSDAEKLKTSHVYLFEKIGGKAED